MLKPAFDEARGLGHSWVGPEHILLAVLAERTALSESLAALGLTHDRVARLLGSRYPNPPAPDLEPGERPRPNPAFYQAAGWARGFAAAAGLKMPDPGDWLLATIYPNYGGNTVDAVINELGASAEAVIDALRQSGIRVPQLKPPVYRPWRGYRRVDVAEGDLEPILALLNERHPAGSEWRWGFNYTSGEPRNAYVISEDGIDLDAIVAEARQRASDRG